MNADTTLALVEHIITLAQRNLRTLNVQQADRLSQKNGEGITFDWSQMTNRVNAQAEAEVAAELHHVLHSPRLSGLTDEQKVAELQTAILSRVASHRTPRFTDQMSNLIESALQERRVVVAQMIGALPR